MVEPLTVSVPVLLTVSVFALSAKLEPDLVSSVPATVRLFTTGVAAPSVTVTLELIVTSSAVPGVPPVPVQPVHILPLFTVFQVPEIVAVHTASSAICH